MYSNSDTIAAQATPPGRGGVGIIRVSGPQTVAIAEKVLCMVPEARYAYFSKFHDANKKVIDEGIAVFFAAPYSFTGEDVLELQGHGGQIIMDLLLQAVIAAGARLAKPGEFLERAFLNNKIDLTQAEAVADLIDASSVQAAKNAARSLQGDFSNAINDLVALLIEIRTRLEATIDFPEEDNGLLANSWLQIDINNIITQIKNIADIAKQGVIIKEGIRVVITGKPNAGKSSLLNTLAGEEAAIVTDIPGTTRDVLNNCIQIDGIPIHLIDTAGVHDQPDIIEKEGIRRALAEIKRADHVMLLVDAAANSERKPTKLWSEYFQEVPEHANFTVVYNKIDLTGEAAKATVLDGVNCVYLSAKTGAGIDLLRNHLKACAGFHTVESGFSARRRHLDALERAEKHLVQACKIIPQGAIELIAEELGEAQHILGEITGEFTPDDLLGKIFAEFCIGK